MTISQELKNILINLPERDEYTQDDPSGFYTRNKENISVKLNAYFIILTSELNSEFAERIYESFNHEEYTYSLSYYAHNDFIYGSRVHHSHQVDHYY